MARIRFIALSVLILASISGLLGAHAEEFCYDRHQFLYTLSPCRQGDIKLTYSQYEWCNQHQDKCAKYIMSGKQPEATPEIHCLDMRKSGGSRYTSTLGCAPGDVRISDKNSWYEWTRDEGERAPPPGAINLAGQHEPENTKPPEFPRSSLTSEGNNQALDQFTTRPISSNAAFAILAMSLIAALAYTAKAHVSKFAKVIITFVVAVLEYSIFAAVNINVHEVTIGEMLLLQLPFGIGIFATIAIKHHLTA